MAELLVNETKASDICFNCNKTFNSISSLNFHKKWCESKIMCSKCGAKFLSKVKKRKHACFSELKEEQMLFCQICGSDSMKFKTKKELNQHLFSHRITTKYYCSKCKCKSFINREFLQRHLKSHLQDTNGSSNSGGINSHILDFFCLNNIFSRKLN